MPAEPALKDIRRMLHAELARLNKTRAGLLKIRDVHLNALTPGCLELAHQPDGAMVLHMETNTINTIVQDIDKLILRLEAIDIPRDQGGRRLRYGIAPCRGWLILSTDTTPL